MKHINLITVLFAFAVLSLCVSCANKKVMITGPAGTEIYSPKGNLIATIGADQQVAHKMEKGESYILKAKMPNSDVIVPFAIDYKKGHRTRNIIFMVTGLAVYLPQAWVGIGDEGGFPGSYNMSFDKYINLPRQLNVPTPAFNMDNTPSDVTPTIPVKAKTLNKESVSSSTKTLNVADKVKGEYKCTGSLMQGQEKIESYPEITVRITKINNNSVAVNVIETGNVQFFAKDEEYSISRLKSGGYELSNKLIPTAKININKNGEITYFHPSVVIDGEKYSLNLKSRL